MDLIGSEPKLFGCAPALGCLVIFSTAPNTTIPGVGAAERCSVIALANEEEIETISFHLLLGMLHVFWYFLLVATN